MAITQTSLEGGARPSKLDVLNTEITNYRNGLTQISKEELLLQAQKDLLNEGKPNLSVVNAPIEVAYSSVNLSPEEKFYQSLGLKNKGGLTLPLKSKGRLLVAVVLVAGYFAYKKFKK